MSDYIADVRVRIDAWDRCYPGNHDVELMIDDAKDRIDALTAMVRELADKLDLVALLAREEERDPIARLYSIRDEVRDATFEAHRLIGEDGK